MTVSTTTSKASASANGTQHSFAYGFKIFADADLAVTVRAADGTETLKTLNTHYVVTNAGSSSGGNVCLSLTPAIPLTLILATPTSDRLTARLLLSSAS